MSLSQSTLRQVFAGVNDLSGLIRLSHQCLKQYQARHLPGLSLDRTRAELYRRIITAGVFATEKPHWIVSAHTATVGWLLIEEEIALPVREDRTQTRPLVAATTLYRLPQHSSRKRPGAERSATSAA